MSLTPPPDGLPAALESPRLEFVVAVAWVLLACATLASLATSQRPVLSALVAWMGGYLTPYVLHQARAAYRKARAT